MRIERHVDCGKLYDQQRRDLLRLVADAADDELDRRVPATPDWDVRDVVAHLVGITADLNAQRFPATTGEAWTAAQVADRRGRSVAELAAEWDRETPGFCEGLALFGYDFGSHYLGDLLQHATDVRTVLGADHVTGVPLTVALDFYLTSFEETLVDAGVGGVRVQLPGEDWVLGPDPVVATVAAGPFELFRALGGRRSEAQIRSFAWTGAVDLVVPLVSRYPMPAQPLTD